MTTLVSALDTEFTPAVGDFNVNVPHGVATLLRKDDAGAEFAVVQSVVAPSPTTMQHQHFSSPAP